MTGPTLCARLPRPSDAPALFALASDPEVTRWLSWGAYRHEEEARAFLGRLSEQREAGERLELILEHRDHGPIGLSGLSEYSPRDRRAVIGTWLGRDWWGTGANGEAKALICRLGFGAMGLDRIGAYANVDHARSQRALERLGFRHEGVLRAFHRHGDRALDVAVLGLLREEWEAGPLSDVEVVVQGVVPPAFAGPGHRGI